MSSGRIGSVPAVVRDWRIWSIPHRSCDDDGGIDDWEHEGQHYGTQAHGGAGRPVVGHGPKVFVGIACDAGLVPDHQQIVDGFADAFGRLAIAQR